MTCALLLTSSDLSVRSFCVLFSLLKFAHTFRMALLLYFDLDDEDYDSQHYNKKNSNTYYRLYTNIYIIIIAILL
jgi:hypothetical protein